MHATNINHQNTTPAESELAQTLRGTISVIENTANLVANFDTTLEATRYANNQATDITTGRLLGNALWSIKPGQLEWFVSDVYTQTALDPLSSNTPSNRQNVNALTTGPNYYVRINRRSNLALEARVENYAYDNAQIDNSRVFGASRLDYMFTSSISSNLRYETSQVMYENNVLNNRVSNPDFNRNDVFLGLFYQRNVNRAELQGGYTIINYDGMAAETRESRYLLALENRRTRTTTIRAEYSRNISDTSSDLRSVISTDNINLLATSALLYVRTSTSLNITNTLSSGTLILNIHKTDSDYLTDDRQDQTEKGASLTNFWNISGNSSFAIDGSYIQSSYFNRAPQRINEDYLYGANYTYHYGRNININLRAEQAERKSTESAQTYDDTRIMLTLEYVSR